MQDDLAALLDRAAGERRPAIRYLERTWSAADLVAEADRVAAGLAQSDLTQAGPAGAGLRPGERIGIALPNLPAAVVALLACWRGGFVAAPVDPRRPVDALLDWQAEARPAALVTLDLATVFERTRPLFAEAGLRRILVARMADQLSTLKRLVAPWLRAGGTARRPPDARFLSWPGPAAASSAPARPGGTAPALLLPEEAATLDRASAAALARGLEGPALLALPLATRPALAALLGALAGGGPLLLSPRLDARALDKVVKATGITRRII